MNRLLLEIGTEEIPAGYIEPALAAMRKDLLKRLADARIDYKDASLFGTPRRLAIIVDDVAARQRPLKTEIIGPPKKVAFDEDGTPRIPAIKFAEKVGVRIEDVRVVKTEKGEYLSAVKTDKGMAAIRVLKEILPLVIKSIPFPKRMRWADLTVSFARPVHSIVALLGEKVIGFEFGGIRAGRYTKGHSFMVPGKIRIKDADQYTELLEDAFVIPDIEKRRNEVLKSVKSAATGIDGNIVEDDELLGIVTNLVEFPVATAGGFEKEYLALPEEILITAMKRHQKYFAVTDKNGRLMPAFIAVNNTRTRDEKLVALGHERVLRARLSDAAFFFRADRRRSLESRVEDLKGVLFQAELGSMYDKVMRIVDLSVHIAELLNGDDLLRNHVAKAALLCKTDLVTEVVGEFPELQGIMGRIYAKKDGLPDTVSAAIEEHYRPAYSGGPLPENKTGAILAIADKMDSICGFFKIGLVPTGAADPYALRRQGIGIVQIMLEYDFGFSLEDLVIKSLELHGLRDEKKKREVAGGILDFFESRITYMLLDEGHKKDIISSVTGLHITCVPDIWKRVVALDSLRSKKDFESIAVAFKRVVNIIRQANMNIRAEKDVDESLFEHPTEKKLWEEFNLISAGVRSRIEKKMFDEALHEVVGLKDAIDAFFDDVMVMTEERSLRENRLALLCNISAMFALFADFTRIST